MGGTLAEEGNCAIRLAIEVLRVAAARAGAIVVLLELGLQVVEVRNALGCSPGAEADRRMQRRRRQSLLGAQGSREKRNCEHCRQNRWMILHGEHSFIASPSMAGKKGCVAIPNGLILHPTG